jgi:hypothetical protein
MSTLSWPRSPGRPHRRKPRQTFSIAEDHGLVGLVQRLGEHDWTTVASQMPGRTARQCRDRWKCYLSPQLSTEEWSESEDQMLIDEYSRIGPRWTTIASAMKRRSEVAVKNRWKLLRRRTKGGSFPTRERSPPDVRDRLPRAQRPSMPSLPSPEPPVDPTAVQRELEIFFQSLGTPVGRKG